MTGLGPTQHTTHAGAEARPSGAAPFWHAGEQIGWHYRRRAWVPGMPQHVFPMTVVRDNHRELIVWLAPATTGLAPRLPDGRELRAEPIGARFVAPRAQARVPWLGQGVLCIAPTGAPWSIWLFWTWNWEFDCWYVNLEDPHNRDDGGVYSQDHVLDVVVTAAGRVTRRDEDELAAAVAQGRYDCSDAEQFARDAEAAEALAAARGRPFCEPWPDWRPGPLWPVAELPADASWDIDLTSD